MEEQIEVKVEENVSTSNQTPREAEQEKQKAEQEKVNDKKQKSRSKELTPEQVQKRKKMLVYPILFLAFVGCMYLIFAPSETDEEQVDGYNPELPMPDAGSSIITDKITAYEQERSVDSQRERNTLQDFMIDNLQGTNEQPRPDHAVAEEEEKSSLLSSAQAHRDMGRELSEFYRGSNPEPVDDQKTLELEWRLQELEKKLKLSESEKNATDDQLALMEKSYQMAAKYMANPSMKPVEAATVNPSGAIVRQAESTPVSAVEKEAVSGLMQSMSDSAFMAEYSKPRNMGFNTAVGRGYSIPKNTIRACVHENQTLTDGQSVRLRLLESLQAGEIIIPINSLITGVAKIQGERLDVEISTLEYAGNIIPVELAVHDSDGSKGIYIPSSMEREALNEAMANIGQGLGSSISFTQSAGQQLTMDVTRGLMQGASGYLGKKFRTVKVTLKAGYQVMLYTKVK